MRLKSSGVSVSPIPSMITPRSGVMYSAMGVNADGAYSAAPEATRTQKTKYLLVNSPTPVRVGLLQSSR